MSEKLWRWELRFLKFGCLSSTSFVKFCFHEFVDWITKAHLIWKVCRPTILIIFYMTCLNWEIDMIKLIHCLLFVNIYSVVHRITGSWPEAFLFQNWAWLCYQRLVHRWPRRYLMICLFWWQIICWVASVWHS